MTMTMTRLANPPQKAPAPPARGSAQRTAVITLGPRRHLPADPAPDRARQQLAGRPARRRRDRHRPDLAEPERTASYARPTSSRWPLFVAAGAASGLVSPLPTTALLTLAIDILLFAWCTTVVNVLAGPRAMRYALVAWSWSGIVWAGIFIAAWLGHITPLEGITAADGNRLMFTFGDPNYASWYWDATIFVVYASRTPGRRWIRFVGYAMLLWALVLTESNGGVLALGIGVSFLLMVKNYRRHGWAGAVATVLVIGLAVGTFFTVLPLNKLRHLAATSHQPLLVNSIGRSAQSSNERGLLIQESIELYQRSDGVLGLGPASTKPLLTAGLYPYANEAHDDFLAALSERGVLGLFALRAARRQRCRASRAGAPVGNCRRRWPPPCRPGGHRGRLLALGVNSFYEEVLHFRPLWLLFGITAVLGRDAWRMHQAGQQRRFARLRPAAMTRLATRPPGKAHGSDGAVAASRCAVPSRPTFAPLPAPVPAPPRRPGSRVLSRQAITNLGAQGGCPGRRCPWPACWSPGSAVRPCSASTRCCACCPGCSGSSSPAACRPPRRSSWPASAARTGGCGPRSRCWPWPARASASLAWLACAVPFHHVFFRQMPISLVFAHDRPGRHPAVDGHGQGLLPGQRRHRRREPGHRGRRSSGSSRSIRRCS